MKRHSKRTYGVPPTLTVGGSHYNPVEDGEALTVSTIAQAGTSMLSDEEEFNSEFSSSEATSTMFYGSGESARYATNKSTRSASFSENTPNARKTTPLFNAMEKGNWKSVLMFLQSGKFSTSSGQSMYGMAKPIDQVRTWVSMYRQDNRLLWRQLPLHYALSNQAPLEVIEMLMRLYPLAVETPDSEGNLPLHHAMKHICHNKTIELILQEYPAAIDITNGQGLLPLECITTINNEEAGSRGKLLHRYLQCAKSIAFEGIPPLKDELLTVNKTIEATKSELRLAKVELNFIKQQEKMKAQRKEQEEVRMKSELQQLRSELEILRSEREKLSAEKEHLSQQCQQRWFTGDNPGNNTKNSWIASEFSQMTMELENSTRLVKARHGGKQQNDDDSSPMKEVEHTPLSSPRSGHSYMDITEEDKSDTEQTHVGPEGAAPLLSQGSVDGPMSNSESDDASVGASLSEESGLQSTFEQVENIDQNRTKIKNDAQNPLPNPESKDSTVESSFSIDDLPAKPTRSTDVTEETKNGKNCTRASTNEPFHTPEENYAQGCLSNSESEIRAESFETDGTYRKRSQFKTKDTNSAAEEESPKPKRDRSSMGVMTNIETTEKSKTNTRQSRRREGGVPTSSGEEAAPSPRSRRKSKDSSAKAVAKMDAAEQMKRRKPSQTTARNDDSSIKSEAVYKPPSPKRGDETLETAADASIPTELKSDKKTNSPDTKDTATFRSKPVVRGTQKSRSVDIPAEATEEVPKQDVVSKQSQSSFDESSTVSCTSESNILTEEFPAGVSKDVCSEDFTNSQKSWSKKPAVKSVTEDAPAELKRSNSKLRDDLLIASAESKVFRASKQRSDHSRRSTVWMSSSSSTEEQPTKSDVKLQRRQSATRKKKSVERSLEDGGGSRSSRSDSHSSSGWTSSDSKEMKSSEQERLMKSDVKARHRESSRKGKTAKDSLVDGGGNHSRKKPVLEQSNEVYPKITKEYSHASQSSSTWSSSDHGERKSYAKTKGVVSAVDRKTKGYRSERENDRTRIAGLESSEADGRQSPFPKGKPGASSLSSAWTSSADTEEEPLQSKIKSGHKPGGKTRKVLSSERQGPIGYSPSNEAAEKSGRNTDMSKARPTSSRLSSAWSSSDGEDEILSSQTAKPRDELQPRSKAITERTSHSHRSTTWSSSGDEKLERNERGRVQSDRKISSNKKPQKKKTWHWRESFSSDSDDEGNQSGKHDAYSRDVTKSSESTPGRLDNKNGQQNVNEWIDGSKPNSLVSTGSKNKPGIERSVTARDHKKPTSKDYDGSKLSGDGGVLSCKVKEKLSKLNTASTGDDDDENQNKKEVPGRDPNARMQHDNGEPSPRTEQAKEASRTPATHTQTSYSRDEYDNARPRKQLESPAKKKIGLEPGKTGAKSSTEKEHRYYLDEDHPDFEGLDEFINGTIGLSDCDEHVLSDYEKKLLLDLPQHSGELGGSTSDDVEYNHVAFGTQKKQEDEKTPRQQDSSVRSIRSMADDLSGSTDNEEIVRPDKNLRLAGYKHGVSSSDKDPLVIPENVSEDGTLVIPELGTGLASIETRDDDNGDKQDRDDTRPSLEVSRSGRVTFADETWVYEEVREDDVSPEFREFDGAVDRALTMIKKTTSKLRSGDRSPNRSPLRRRGSRGSSSKSASKGNSDNSSSHSHHRSERRSRRCHRGRDSRRSGPEMKHIPVAGDDNVEILSSGQHNKGNRSYSALELTRSYPVPTQGSNNDDSSWQGGIEEIKSYNSETSNWRTRRGRLNR